MDFERDAIVRDIMKDVGQILAIHTKSAFIMRWCNEIKGSPFHCDLAIVPN